MELRIATLREPQCPTLLPQSFNNIKFLFIFILSPKTKTSVWFSSEAIERHRIAVPQWLSDFTLIHSKNFYHSQLYQLN